MGNLRLQLRNVVLRTGVGEARIVSRRKRHNISGRCQKTILRIVALVSMETSLRITCFKDTSPDSEISFELPPVGVKMIDAAPHPIGWPPVGVDKQVETPILLSTYT